MLPINTRHESMTISFECRNPRRRLPRRCPFRRTPRHSFVRPCRRSTSRTSTAASAPPRHPRPMPDAANRAATARRQEIGRHDMDRLLRLGHGRRYGVGYGRARDPVLRPCRLHRSPARQRHAQPLNGGTAASIGSPPERTQSLVKSRSRSATAPPVRRTCSSYQRPSVSPSR